MVPAIGTTARRLFVEGPNSLGQRARERRWSTFGEGFPALNEMAVLDLGGTAESWMRAPIRPARVHLVNTTPPAEGVPEWITAAQGDACALPEDLLSGQFDLVFSNSVVEHVGGHARRLEFAEMVEAAAPHHWIQTPYRYFPIEPHLVTPCLQYLPLWFRSRIGLHWPLAHSRPTNLDGAIESQLGTELLDITQLRFYFPGSKIRYERFAGLVKSIIAIK